MSTIFESLMAKASEWRVLADCVEDINRTDTEPGRHTTIPLKAMKFATGLFGPKGNEGEAIRMCATELEALAKQVCETAKRTVTANSEEHGALMISSLYVNAEIIGGPK